MNSKRIRIIISILIAAALCLSMSACGKKEEAPLEPANDTVSEDLTREIPQPQPEPEQEPEPLPEEPKFYHPLTGVEVEEDMSSIRPFAVMINNIVTAIPQWGISKADIIYEVPVEGGITRFLAIFTDPYSADIIGSVRSSRPYYIDLLKSYGAIYVHAGGSKDAMNLLQQYKVDRIDGVNGSGETFFRDQWRKEHMGLEHSLMLDMKKVKDYLAKHNISEELDEKYRNILTFTDEAQPAGEMAQDAKEFTVHVTRSKKTMFKYNEETGLYEISQHGGPLLDTEWEENYTAKNVLTLSMKMWSLNDSKGRLGGEFTGEGEGTFYCEGKSIPIKWSKKDLDSPYEYTLEDGTPLMLGRGRTFICIVPPSMGYVEDGLPQ